MDIQRATKEIEFKLAQAEDKRAWERNIQLQLSFEHSQIQFVNNRTRKDIERLSKEEKVLLEAVKSSSRQLKRIRNYFNYLCPMQVDRKSEWMQNLRGELNQLDFNLEVHEEEPTRSVDSYTQVVRR